MSNAILALTLSNVLCIIGFFAMWAMARDWEKGCKFWSDKYYELLKKTGDSA